MSGKTCGMCGCDMNAKGHSKVCGCMAFGKLLFALGLAASVAALVLALRESSLWGFDAMFWYINGIVLLLLSSSCKSCARGMKMKMMGGCGGSCGAGCDDAKGGACCNEMDGEMKK
jgi:hypothetical protein